MALSLHHDVDVLGRQRLQLDGQAMAVPARDVLHLVAVHRLELVDGVLRESPGSSVQDCARTRVQSTVQLTLMARCVGSTVAKS